MGSNPATPTEKDLSIHSVSPFFVLMPVIMFHVYILQSEKTGRYYIGSTGNLADRLERHTNGRSKATMRGCPWNLVFTEEYNTRREAYHREMEIKSWKSHTRIAQLVSASR